MPTADNGAVRIYYELSGVSQGEVLMLGNSLGSNLHMWNKVAPMFEAGHRVLRYDMRGHGGSSVPPDPFTIRDLGGDVLFLLEHLGIDRVHFCGLSLGGLVAMWIGIHAPERVGRMVLANTAAHIGTREMWEQRIAAIETSGMAPLAMATLDRWFTPRYRNQHPQEMDAIREMIAATHPKGYVACCGVLRDTDLSAGMVAIEAPCLVITGTHDPATPASDGRALHSVLRRSEYVELDASHLSAWERAAEFGDAVLEFIEREERHDG